MFAHVKNGIRSVIVFENTLAYLMHRNNTYESTLSSQALASGLKLESGEVKGLPLEYRKDDYIRDSFGGSVFTDTANLFDRGPIGIYGWINVHQNSTNARDSNKPIV
jgi:hypothetical protein